MDSYIQICESLFELAEILGKQSDYKEILRVVSTKTSTMFNSDITSIQMINPHSHGTYKTVMKKETQIDKEQYSVVQSIIIAWVMLNKKAILLTNLKKDERFKENLFNNFPIVSAMCVPLYCGDASIGYLVLMNKSGKNSFTENDFQILQKIAVISAPYLSNVQKIKEYFNISLPESTLINKYKIVGLLGKSKKFFELLHSIEAASKCDVRVVLEGETGTGKELVVKAIHNFSKRSGFPFVAVDCGAIPNNLIESELFGHVKGSFTGANQDRKGLILEANKGTLFLDEICNLSLEMQAKLLRVLQEGEIRPVGSSKLINVDVRFIAASSVSLLELVEKKEFREDLYFRLMVYPINMPTLNERKADILLIATFFLNKFSKKQNKKAEFFHKDISEYLKEKKWSGNIRELENFIERLVTNIPNDIETVELTVLPEKLKEEINNFKKGSSPQKVISFTLEVENFEKEMITRSLDDNDWNQSQAARMLEIPEQTLRYKMKKLGLFRVK
ncbi:MAG: sigma-54-dependent Fis family transcriptional regulator [Ignavibacteriales bacterium]|nr:sigma-54-dependent Fis family transcriptional regulator [Ignavibacteriales bacterium]